MHALLITAVYIGISHYYGVPYGLIGVVMAFIPGWLIGKSMLETRGFFWAWFIHFWMDVVVFLFMPWDLLLRVARQEGGIGIINNGFQI